MKPRGISLTVCEAGMGPSIEREGSSGRAETSACGGRGSWGGSPAEEPRWYCVRCQPKHEHIAAANLRTRAGLEVLCPRVRFRKETRRGVVWFVEALFPGYLFAKFDFARDHRSVRHTHGVSGIVHFGETYPALEEETIAGLREFDRNEGEAVTVETPLAEGEEVRIGEGALRGMTATVSAILPARDRVRVLVEFLGGLTEVEIHGGALIREAHPLRLLDRLFARPAEQRG